MKLATLPALLLLSLSACGGGGQAEQTADALEEAAEQSDPAAAQVLENAADRIEEREGVTAPGEPGSAAQEALQKAGNAQAGTLADEQPAPPSVQAQPNRTGQQTPPPKVRTPPEQPQ